MAEIQIPRTRLHLYNVQIDNNYSNHSGSIVLPYRIRRIVGICPNMVNGAGLVSIYNEKNNEQLINQQLAADDNQLFNKKNIPLISYPEGGNLRYNLNILPNSSNTSRVCRLKIYIKYEE